MLVLVNTILFKAEWLRPFSDEKTIKGNFTALDGSSIEVDMMKQVQRFKYFSKPHDIDADVVELPYSDLKSAMTIILPHKDVLIEDLEAQLYDSSVLKSILESEGDRVGINLALPRFKLEWKRELADTLKKMGANLMFSEERADFSGITENNPNDHKKFMISHVFQKAYVEVNEAGTVASAATFITMTRSMIYPEKDFVCNRPFLFIIHDKIFNNILFMGKYVK
jgi:serpin B